MTWSCQDDFELFCAYLDIDGKMFCPTITCFSQLSLDMFNFSDKTINRALEMYYFHFKKKFFHADVTLHSKDSWSFLIKSSCSTNIYQVSIKCNFPSSKTSNPAYFCQGPENNCTKLVRTEWKEGEDGFLYNN